MRAKLVHLVSIAVAAIAMGGPASAADPKPAAKNQKKQCIRAHGLGQVQRKAFKFRIAAREFEACARDVCPEVLRKECSRWVKEIRAEQPSIVVDARAADGNEITSVKVFVDDALAMNRLDGEPFEIDPGERVFRFQDSTGRVVEKKITIEIGDKNRKVSVSFSGVTPTAAPTQPTTPPEEQDAPGPSPLAYVLIGVGGAGLINSLIFGIAAKSQESDLKSTCAPDCSREEVDTMRTKYLVSDISLGVGVVALAAGAYFFFNRPEPDKEPEAEAAWMVDFQPRTGGGYFSAGARF